jgi:hypothetical protein
MKLDIHDENISVSLTLPKKVINGQRQTVGRLVIEYPADPHYKAIVARALAELLLSEEDQSKKVVGTKPA